MSIESISTTVQAHRDFFATHQTKSLAFRRQQLLALRAGLQKYEAALYEALWIDLHKSEAEAFFTEMSMIYQEIRNHLRHLRRWTRVQRVSSPLQLWPSHSRFLIEPLGVALIIAPWNYPVQLLLNPLVGAIAAGCCAVLKPSPYTPHVSALLARLVTETFDSRYISLFEGDRHINTALLAQRFDIIFFTGSPALGRVVMAAAARNLTPVVLELGGKSPCIVHVDANLRKAARRIIWGKTINAGQTCVAPDYLLVHESIKEQLMVEMKAVVHEFFGDNPQKSDFFGRIVRDEAVQRIETLMQSGTTRIGGTVDAAARYIEPTLLDGVDADSLVMQQEIFGPVLPVLIYSNLQQAIDFVNRREKPLALYFFGSSRMGWQVLRQTSSGGACINDTLVHLANARLPFGGVGNSGMGRYHGRDSLLAFSNRRAVVSSPTWFDLPVKFAPFKGFKWLRRFMK